MCVLFCCCLLRVDFLWLQPIGGLLFVKVLGLLVLVASLVVEHGLTGFSSCGSQALERSLNSLWHTGLVT